MFCPNCGKELPDNALFCTECGQPMNQQTPPSPVYTPPVDNIPRTTYVQNGAAYEIPTPTANETPSAPAGAMPYTQIPNQQGYAPVPPAGPAETPYTQIPNQQGYTPVPPAGPSGETPYTQIPNQQGYAPVPPAGPSAPDGGGKRRGRAPLIIGIVAAVLVVAVAAVAAIFTLGRGGKGTQNYVYLTDDNELMFLADLNEKTTAVEISDEVTLSSRVAFSKDGKYLYYIEMKPGDSSGDLFRAEVSQLSKDGDSPLKISSGVLGFSVLDNGDLIYHKDRSGETQVFLYSGEESYKLASGVAWRGFNEDQTHGYYTESDGDGISLYRIELKPDGEKETLIKRADNIFSSYTADVLLYGEADGMDAGYNTLYTLYSLVPGGEKERLVKDVSSVMGVTTKDGALSFYYTTCQEEKYTLYDFVSDSMKNSDASSTVEEPVYPDYYDDYYPRYGIYTTDDGREYYETYSGKVYYIDYSRYPGMDNVSIAYEMADDLFDEALEEYNKQYDEWYAVSRRNYMRDMLSDEPYNITSYTLHHYANGESKEVATRMTGAYLPNSALSVDVCFYRKAPGVDGKLADLADLEYYYDVYDLIYDSYSVDYSFYYLNVSGHESEFKLEEDSSIDGLYVISDQELAIWIDEDGEESLRSYSIGSDTLTYQKTIVEDEFSVSSINDGKLYYYADWDYNRSEGDLYCYSNGESSRIATEINTYYEVADGDAQYILTDRDYDSRKGVAIAEFAMLDKDGKSVRITDEVTVGRIWFPDSKTVMYISDGDLYYWDGAESRRIASDVEYLWLSQQESYRSY